jgi:hypothetical protein
MTTRRFWIDLLERTLRTYLQAFLGLVVASGFAVDGVVDLSLLTKAGIAAIPAGIAVLMSGLARFKGDPATASLVDAPPDRKD